MRASLTYLDNAASEPLRPQVWQAMQNAYESVGVIGANPSASHEAGRRASALLEDARARIADALKADPAEVVFCAGGTESVAIGVRGMALGIRHKLGLDNAVYEPTVLYSAIEHDSVRAAASSLADYAIASKQLPVNSQAVVTIEKITCAEIDYVPLLVSVMSVCNENGVKQPIEEIGRWLRTEVITQVKKRFKLSERIYTPVFHTDAIQALGRVDINFRTWCECYGITALSIAGHKVGGPVNSGVLLITRQAPMLSDRSGGGQERQIRAGTQDVIVAQGLATAVELAVQEQAQIAETHAKLRTEVLQGIAELSANGYLEGVALTTQADSVPGIMQFVLENCEAEALLMGIDTAGVCASAGSACHTGVARPSNVLLAQGYSENAALGSIRISFGWSTTSKDVQRFLEVLPKAVDLSRRLFRRK